MQCTLKHVNDMSSGSPAGGTLRGLMPATGLAAAAPMLAPSEARRNSPASTHRREPAKAGARPARRTPSLPLVGRGGCHSLICGKKRPRELRQFVADLSHSQRIVPCVRQRTEFASQTASEWLRFAESRSAGREMPNANELVSGATKQNHQPQ